MDMNSVHSILHAQPYVYTSSLLSYYYYYYGCRVLYVNIALGLVFAGFLDSFYGVGRAPGTESGPSQSPLRLLKTKQKKTLSYYVHS
jgi:hypothetical protein